MGTRGGARPGGGRPKGALNKDNQDIRNMVIHALTMVGGAHYLAEKAHTHPAAFLGLVGRVLPLQIADKSGEPISIDIRWAPAALIEGQAETLDSNACIERDVAEQEDSTDTVDRDDYRNVQKDRAA